MNRVMLPITLYSLRFFLWSCDRTETDEGCGACTSAACVSAAAAMLSAMDPAVDPCQDFFQYACGRWIQTNPIPAGKPIWGTFDRLWQDNQIVMKTILGESHRRRHII